jgi:hypothetical protein
VTVVIGAALLFALADAAAPAAPTGPPRFGPPPGGPPAASPAAGPVSNHAGWNPFGTGIWHGNGLVTTSHGQLGPGLTFGGAENATPPVTNPANITALSYDFRSDHSGANTGGSPRMVICFSDAANCASNANLGPFTWTANTATHVDGFAPSDGHTNVWVNEGGSCGFVSGTTWAAIVACHSGASITDMLVVNDSGWVTYPATEKIVLDNLTVNNTVGSGP